jgi:hypothetical protein
MRNKYSKVNNAITFMVVLYSGSFILFCSVCVYACVCMSAFCNVCVCKGFVMCGCFWQYVYCTLTEVFLNLTVVFTVT